MASLLTLSNRTEDLLHGDVAPANASVDTFVNRPNVFQKDLEAPKNTKNCVPHELIAPGSRANASIGDYIAGQRMLGGTAFAEQRILELNAASQINRGPDGVFASSRLHFDLLLGRDESIYPSDYLNFDAKC